MINTADQANMAQALARATANDPVNAEQDLGEAGFLGAGPRSILDILRQQQAREMQREQLMAQRGNLMAQLRHREAMQGPQLDTQLQVARIGAQKPTEAGLWNLLKAQAVGANQTRIQEVKGDQQLKVQDVKGRQMTEQLTIQQQNAETLERLKHAGAMELRQMIESGAMNRHLADNSTRWEIAKMLAEKKAPALPGGFIGQSTLMKTMQEVKNQAQQAKLTKPDGSPLTEADFYYTALNRMRQTQQQVNNTPGQ